MAKYRRKEIVEAFRWFKDGDHPKVKPMHGTSYCIYCGDSQDNHGYFRNKYGNDEPVCPGSWVVTDGNGNLEIYRPAVFDVMFELIKDKE